ncbi:vitamin K epoxide reductase complex subunit 1 [Chrysoperla carnea]|uniref:vitamin K epoxide reductase complex subunit 1 n=1 Tax=Chrysoperla carnea TaxID=189513 RepID=UPI001D072227|nr:vitamin K epoxide reductase complex subunit 1 [Chrysoperla carnea]
MKNQFSLNFINTLIIFTNIIGFILSLYAYHVETQKEIDVNYEAMCDINEFISCSKAFSSKYGKGFGIVKPLLGEESIFYQPNSLFGLIFYTTISILSLFNTIQSSKVMLIMSIASNFGSVYLAFILYLLQDICVVCVSTYIVNLVNLLLSWIKLKTIKSKVHRD